MTKYYSSNGGPYFTYDYLHNEHGWTDHPTTQIDIKSIEPWGGVEDIGLMDLGSEVVVDAMHASYFLNGTAGWWTINTLLTNLGCYPGIGTDNNIVNNGTIQCYAAIIYGELQHPYYLVEKATELGWMDEDTFADNGWVLGELPSAQLVPIYVQSGTLSYQSSVKNNTTKSNTYCFALYSDDTLSTPYVFDWGKRNVYGRLVDGEFVATPIQTQAEFPSTTGANTGYSICVNKYNSSDTGGYLWFAYNKYQDGHPVITNPRYLMIYDDAISFWFKSDHSDDSNPSFVNWNTGIDYDSSKTYKVLAFVNSDGIKVNDEILYAVTFTEQSGKLIIRLTYFTSSSKPAARVVFYAE